MVTPDKNTKPNPPSDDADEKSLEEKYPRDYSTVKSDMTVPAGNETDVADMSDEVQREQLDDIRKRDIESENVMYGSDETNFDHEYFDNEDEDEYYDDPDEPDYHPHD